MKLIKLTELTKIKLIKLSKIKLTKLIKMELTELIYINIIKFLNNLYNIVIISVIYIIKYYIVNTLFIRY